MKLYGNMAFKNGKWVLWDIPTHVVIKLKSLFPKIPKGAFQPFLLNHSKEVCSDLEWFIVRYPLSVQNSDLEYLKSEAIGYRKHIDECEMIFTGDYKPGTVELKPGKVLKKFQQQAADLFWKSGRVLDADPIGSGKTVIAIGAMANKDFLPAVVVVQPHLVTQWCSQISTFSFLRSVGVQKSLPANIKDHDVVVVKYSMISKYVDDLLKLGFKTFVLDEIQEVRRSESQKHVACAKLASEIPYCLGLSGTPIYNYGGEVYNIFKVVNPTVFPEYSDFSREWLGYSDRVKNPEALGSYLKSTYSYIRRTEDEIASEMPPLNTIVHTVGFDNEAMDKIKADAKVLALSVLQGSFIERGQASRELSVLVRHATGVSKAKHIAEYAKLILSSGEKVLLSLWHRDVYDIVMEELKEYKPVLYTGTESQSQKDKNKAEFIYGKSQVMLISLRSGVGLDGLQDVCNHVVIGELDFTNAVHEQIIGRLRREGQKKNVTAIFLISDSGSDPVVVDIVGLKKSQFDGIFGSTKDTELEINDDSVIKEFAKRYLEINA